MVAPILDTPRTDLGDLTRFSNAADLDFTVDNSIPSPSKDSNDLLKQIRGMGGPNIRTPRPRAPFMDRRNLPSKNEFTPLLKSATRNRLMHSSGPGKENRNLEMPAGLKASYGVDSPGLPLNSSIIHEEHTESSAGDGDGQATTIPPVSSSSALSTPMAVLPRRGEGPLDHGRNLATLREQEARLEQIDKENFSLKLKIHFMEDALRKNGKEFNEAAIKENTELKVDKVTLQRDLKQYRKSLAQAEKDLEEYKKQLLDYADKVKRRHASEGQKEEMDQLRRTIAERDAEVDALRKQVDSGGQQDGQLEKLQEDVVDLEAELREKEQALDEKEAELQSRKDNASSKEGKLEGQLQEKEKLLEEKEEDIQGLQDALKSASSKSDKKLQAKDRMLEEKDDELRELEDQLKIASSNRSNSLRNKETQMEEKLHQIQELQTRLQDVDGKVEEIIDLQVQVHALKDQLQTTENNMSAEVRKKSRVIEEKDYEIHALQRKLEAAQRLDQDTEKLHDSIRNLEADLHEKERLIDDKVDQLKTLEGKLRDTEEELDEELIQAQDRIQELEIQQERNAKELQALRHASSESSTSGQHALESARDRIRDLEEERNSSARDEQQLREDIDVLEDEVRRMKTVIERKEAEFSADRDRWDSQRKALESQKIKAEENASGVQKTLSQLQEAQGTLSSRELSLQQNLQNEEQRHESEVAALRKQLEETADELSLVKKELVKAHNQESGLREKIQDLEDEIGVLQDDDLPAAKYETESLRRQLRGLQQDLAKAETEQENVRAQLAAVQTGRQASSSPQGIPSPQRALDKEVRDLKDQLCKVKKERQELHNQLTKAQMDSADAKADLDTLQLDLQTHSGSRTQLQQKLQDLQGKLSITKKEKQVLQDSLTTATSDINALQAAVSDLEIRYEAAEKQSRDLRTQLQTLQREADRKLQSQVSAYEHDIQNLEQDLEDARVRQENSSKASEHTEQNITRLKAKIASLEKDLAIARAAQIDRDTMVEERKDLHEMLKDAKLRAEDLALQVLERDSRTENLATKEAELRAQLKRVREERATQSARADDIAKELDILQKSHDQHIEELRALQALQRQVRFPKSSLTASTTNVSTVLPKPEDLEKAEKRHAAELRGLVRQIEYMGARCRREEAFRQDLGYVKAYFFKQVEMYSEYNEADLRLVRAMGIPTNDVLEEEAWLQVQKSGAMVERAGGRGMRPGLRTVGLMVLASVRMKRAAEKWGVVRKGHDGLLRKLDVVRRARGAGGAVGVGNGLSARKASRGVVVKG